MTPELLEWVLGQNPVPSPTLKLVEKETALLPDSVMQISQDQGALMTLLVKISGSAKALEIGCYTGYSGICIATGLPDSGKLITLEKDETVARIASKNFKRAGLDHKIDIRVGDALTTLSELSTETMEETFDFCFIDADKTSYDAYYEHCLRITKPGGLILVDNVIWGGKVVDEREQSPDTEAIRCLNQKILTDIRVEKVMLHISDGIYVVRKKETH